VTGGQILTCALKAHATATPEALAVRESGRAWSFAALDAQAEACVAGLRAMGVRAGDRVGLLAAPSASAIALLAAAGRVGACVAPLGTRLTGPELAAAGDEIRPRLAVHDDGHARPAATLGVTAMPLEALAADSGRRAASAIDVDPAAPGVAILTSGTTGRPKAVVLSQAALAASAAAWSAALPAATGWLLCLGLAHVAGLGVVWRAIGAGVPLDVVPAFEAEAVLDALRRGSASHLSLVPTQLAQLLDADAGGAQADHAARDPGPGVRAVLLGGAPITPALVTRALKAGWPVVPTYGLTEAGSGVTALATAEAASRPDSAGRALPGVGVRVWSAAPDGAGEIQVRTPACFSGYLGRPEATAAALGPDGWLRTGDIGRLDADGLLYVLERRDDLLVSGGENVYPAEVEASIETHPAIAEACVVARPDSGWGAVPIAAVVIRPGAPIPTDAELRGFCHARLAPYKVPVAFHVVARLPRTPAGKLRRAEVRAMLSAARPGSGPDVSG
jgi:O-succinylbenzoic acid--CoA ligase